MKISDAYWIRSCKARLSEGGRSIAVVEHMHGRMNCHNTAVKPTRRCINWLSYRNDSTRPRHKVGVWACACVDPLCHRKYNKAVWQSAGHLHEPHSESNSSSSVARGVFEGVGLCRGVGALRGPGHSCQVDDLSSRNELISKSKLRCCNRMFYTDSCFLISVCPLPSPF